MTDTNQLDAILAPLKKLSLGEQLKFWRKFRAIHRRRVANTEAPLCPAVFKAVDEHIESLKLHIAKGV